jgi:hypothetical protein
MKWSPTLPRFWWLAPPLAIAALAASWQFSGMTFDAGAPQSASDPTADPTSEAIKKATKPIRAMVAPVPAAPPSAGQEGSGGNDLLPPTAAEPIANIFAVRTWEPPAPVVDGTPPPPQAPPLPFQFLGKIVEPGKNIAFILTQGLRVFVVHVGEPVAGEYLVEKYEGGQLLFRYRPMNIIQSLDVGSRS